MAEPRQPTILPPPHPSDDEVIARHPPIPTSVGGESPLVIMELLQRLKVRDVMRKDIIVLSRRDTIRRAQELMKKNHISGIPIAEGGRLYGIISMDDIIRALMGGWIDDLCAKHMSTHLIVMEADMPVAFALRYFENYNYGRFPVLDKDHVLVGLISQRDVTRVLLYELTVEINKLERKNAAQNGGQSDSSVYMLREYAIVRNDFENAGKAANDIKKLLRERGVDPRLTRRIAVAAYELEINICIHSYGGSLTFMVADGKATVIAKDTGPGIPDVVWACQDGTSTANDWIRSLGFGAGMGLSNSKRVSDRFDIQSTMGKGTTVTCEFNLHGEGTAATPAPAVVPAATAVPLAHPTPPAPVTEAAK